MANVDKPDSKRPSDRDLKRRQNLELFLKIAQLLVNALGVLVAIWN